jgi:competence protein ComEC
MRRPLTYLSITFIAGILAGSYLMSYYYLLLIGLAINLFLLLLSIRNKWQTTGLFLIVSFMFLLGVFSIQKQIYFIKDNQNIYRYIDKGKVTIEGIVIESPLTYSDRNILIIRCLRVLQEKSYIPVSGNIRLAIPSNMNFHYGDFIRFHSTLKKIQRFNNPGNFNYEHIMNIHGIYASGFINNNAGIILLRNNSLSSTRLELESFRDYLKQIIYKNSPSPQREVIEAMTIGNQNEIPADIRDTFNKTGTSHILSISGLHIGMVGATSFLFIFLILKLSEYLMLRFNIIKPAATAAFIVILIYTFISGMEVTVIRSTLMAFIFLIALLSGKQKDLYTTLAAAALIILIISPEALFDISFQLSFVSVLALIYIVPRFRDIPSKKISSLPLWMQSIIRYAYLSVIVCVAATIGTLPLIMYYFNRVSCVTIIANLITVPLLGTLTLAVCMLFILFAFFSPTIAGYFIKLASYLTQISINIINKLAGLPFSYITLTTPNLIEIIFFYLFIFLLIKFIDQRNKQNRNNGFSPILFNASKYLLIITVIFIIADIIYLTFKDKLSSKLTITVIDVGQGNSTLVQFPGGKRMLIDGGGVSESSFDVGKSVIAPFLYKKRIGDIDTIVLSHPHPDHLLGLIYIMNNFSVCQLWKSNLPINLEYFPEWEKAIKFNSININQVSNISSEIIFNGVRVNILWPPNYSLKDIHNLSYDKINDSSLVLKITFGHIKFLIPGDISADIEKRLIQSKADLKSDVLLVPHHGSNHSSSPEFIKAVASRYAIVSAGKSNTFKHPHPSLLERYKEAGVSILRTDRDGAIILTTDGNDLHIDTFIKNR